MNNLKNMIEILKEGKNLLTCACIVMGLLQNYYMYGSVLLKIILN